MVTTGKNHVFIQCLPTKFRLVAHVSYKHSYFLNMIMESKLQNILFLIVYVVNSDEIIIIIQKVPLFHLL